MQIADYFQSGGARPDEFAVGLHNEFHPLEGHDIGQFPGLGSKEQMDEAQAYQLSTWITSGWRGFCSCNLEVEVLPRFDWIQSPLLLSFLSGVSHVNFCIRW